MTQLDPSSATPAHSLYFSRLLAVGSKDVMRDKQSLHN
jgi:hypothetical protein